MLVAVDDGYNEEVSKHASKSTKDRVTRTWLKMWKWSKYSACKSVCRAADMAKEWPKERLNLVRVYVVPAIPDARIDSFGAPAVVVVETSQHRFMLYVELRCMSLYVEERLRKKEPA